MELRHLRYFEAVAATGNVTQAAAHLQISQPSVSQALKELEAELGLQLLVRGSRGTVLTEAGREFSRHAIDILQRLPIASAAARRAAQGSGGQLVVGFAGCSTFDLLPRLVHRVRNELPAIDLRLVEMDTDDPVQALHGRHLDVAIGRPLPHEPGITSQVVARRSFLVALQVRHSLARQRLVTVSQLQGEGLIMAQRRADPGLHAQFMAACGQAGVHLRIAFEARHMSTVPGLVAAGVGVGIVSEELRDLEVRDVVYRPLAEGRGAAQVALSWRRDNDSKTLSQFIALGADAEREETPHAA